MATQAVVIPHVSEASPLDHGIGVERQIIFVWEPKADRPSRRTGTTMRNLTRLWTKENPRHGLLPGSAGVPKPAACLEAYRAHGQIFFYSGAATGGGGLGVVTDNRNRVASLFDGRVSRKQSVRLMAPQMFGQWRKTVPRMDEGARTLRSADTKADRRIFLRQPHFSERIFPGWRAAFRSAPTTKTAYILTSEARTAVSPLQKLVV